MAAKQAFTAGSASAATVKVAGAQPKQSRQQSPNEKESSNSEVSKSDSSSVDAWIEKLNRGEYLSERECKRLCLLVSAVTGSCS